MKTAYSNNYLLRILDKQLSFFLLEPAELELINMVLPKTLQRVEYCFKHSTNKYYKMDGEAYFNPFHSGQWTIFLYILSNTIFKEDNRNRILCDKIYYLNRMLNGCDLYYEVNLPEIFMLDHPVGTVIGRGKFSNYFSFSQGCTVGNNKNIFPEFGHHVKMLSNSKVIGRSKIGNNVIIAASTYIKDQNVDSNLIVFGSSPNLIFKENKYA